VGAVVYHYGDNHSVGYLGNLNGYSLDVGVLERIAWLETSLDIDQYLLDDERPAKLRGPGETPSADGTTWH
jgi:hypothetical protein